MTHEPNPFITTHAVRLHDHVGHRSVPPTRYYPWTNRRDPDIMFDYPGIMTVDPDGNESYTYLVPDVDAEAPLIHVYHGATGHPHGDDRVATVEVGWDYG